MFEIEKIVGHGDYTVVDEDDDELLVREYLVRWMHYGPEEDRYLEEEELSAKMVNEYEAKQGKMRSGSSFSISQNEKFYGQVLHPQRERAVRPTSISIMEASPESVHAEKTLILARLVRLRKFDLLLMVVLIALFVIVLLLTSLVPVDQAQPVL